MTRLAKLALLGAVVLAAVAAGSVAATANSPASLARAGGYSHVVVVIEENYSGAAIMDGGQAPYLKSLARQGTYFPGYLGVSHPSEPNYMALFSGSTQHTDGSDSCIKTSARSIVGEARGSGVSAEGYIEGLSSGKSYACRHDPFGQFRDARGYETDFSRFPSNYADLPQLGFVVPNLVDDMHDNGISPGDRWAKAHLNGYAQWAKTHNSLLIVMSDESDSDPNYSANQPGENGNNALAIVVGARISAGKVVKSRFDHYSLLRTLEDVFGIGRLGASSRASDMFST